MLWGNHSAIGGGSSLSFDYFHAYTQIFIVYEILQLIACAQFLGLGPYPYPARDTAMEALVQNGRAQQGA